MRKTLGALALALSVIGAGIPMQMSAGGAPPCSVTWGSRAKTDRGMSRAHLVDVRAGQHRCFDRLVFDFDREGNGYAVRYRREVTNIASGEPIPLRGTAFLEIVVRSPAYDDNGDPTFPRAGRRNIVDVRGFATFRQVGWAGSFEGITAVGLGVRARLPFRVFALDGPGRGSRLVVDVAHHW